MAAPSITSLTPSTGAIGASVTITGSGFGSTQGTSTVKFNGTLATSTSWGATSIVVTVPTGATTGNVVVTVSGVASAGKSFTVVAAPSITSLSLTSAAVGTSITITGANFGSTQGASTIKFNGTTATPSSWTATTIKAPVPAGATTGNVVVHASGVDSNGKPFTVLPTPTIATLSPSSGAVGASITITGTNFGVTQGTSTIKFNTATASPTSWSDTSIVATVPTGATTGNVVVTVSGVASAGKSFTVVAAPSITSLSPPNGGIGTPVTITGTNFGSTQGTSTVKFNGTSATATSWAATSVGVSVPAGATTGNVIINASGVNSNGKPFTVLPGTFITTGNPNVFHSSFTSTLLNSGKALLAGGQGASGGNALNDGELYDPSAGTFAVTGTLAAARFLHTATLLDNGTVLVAGGALRDVHGNVVPLASAELYNPASAAFVSTGSLNTARQNQSATLLPNGFVLVAGGSDTNSANALATAELYNPATGAFSASGTLIAGRYSHTATLLNNGLVLIVGGLATGGAPQAAAELYNPSTGTFVSTGSLATARAYHTATLLNNGKVLIAGGYAAGASIATAELYDPSTGTFTSAGTLANARYLHTATFLENGTVLIVGGFNSTSSTNLAAAEVYDPLPGAFSLAANLNDARCCHSATLLNTGNVLVSGGSDNLSLTNTAELYQSSTQTPAGLVSITVTPANGSAPVGAAQQFTATGTFSDNSTQVLGSAIWSITSAPVGSITNDASNRGRAYAVAVGSTSVSACVGSICSSANFAATPGPAIGSITPSAATVGTSVTITGTNFGASQGSSAVSFHGAQATPTSWSDTSIIVPVPVGATTGNVVVTVQGISSNGFSFTVLAPSNSLKIQPPSLNMIIGATQQFSVVDAQGVTRTDAAWIVDNSSLATITSDSSPTLTAVAAGQVTLTATVQGLSAQAQVTIYPADGTLPPNTVLWSVPIPGNPMISKIIPAVPNGTDNIDVFAKDSNGYLSAVSKDGELLWRQFVGAGNVTTGFGNEVFVVNLADCFYGTDPIAGSTAVQPHKIQRLDPQTGQLTDIYQFGWQLDHPAGQVVDAHCGNGPVVNAAGSDNSGTDTIIPTPSGTLFIQDLTRVAVMDMATNTLQSSVDLDSSTITPLLGTATTYAPYASKMIVAGDGNAYLAYETYQQTEQPVPPGDNPQFQLVDTVKALRVSPDGTFAAMQLSQRTVTSNGVYTSYVYPQRTSLDDPTLLSIITNADTGATAFVPSADLGQTQTILYPVTASGASSGIPLAVRQFAPVLQREDGNYVGTDRDNHLLALSSAGILWQQTVIPDGFGGALPVYPRYLAADGSITTSSVPVQSASQGTLYVVDTNGALLSQSPDPGLTVSWTGESYDYLSGSLDMFSATPPLYAPTYAALTAGNQSGNGTAILQAISPTPPSAPPEKQLPVPGATLRSNYNSIELLTTVSPDTIFSKYIQTFAGVGNPPAGMPDSNRVAKVVHTPPPPVTASGQVVTFRLKSWLNYVGCGIASPPRPVNLPCPIQGDFSVQIERFDPAVRTVSVVTLKGHPLAGWRYWRVYSNGTMADGKNDIVIETGAVDTYEGPLLAHPFNYMGFIVLKADQIRVWEDDFRYILKAVQANDDPNAAQGSNPQFNRVTGVWDTPPPSQSDIFNNVCQSSACN